MNYYNEFDPRMAEWLRMLIAERVIPAGEVDERSIIDVRPNELRRFNQCHFFAGVGGWAAALRLAGWPEQEQVWTGSAPCQPLSCAGLGKGHADERHVWPAFYELIDQCRPAAVFGEQVASPDGREWLAGVRADLEGIRYAFGAANLCSAGLRAPNIRQRLFWSAEWMDLSQRHRLKMRLDLYRRNGGRQRPIEGCDPNRLAGAQSQQRNGIERPGEHGDGCAIGGSACGLDNSEPERCQGKAEHEGGMVRSIDPSVDGGYGRMVEPIGEGLQRHSGHVDDGHESGRLGEIEAGSTSEAGEPSRLWDQSAWWYCTDDRFRRVPLKSFFQRVASGHPVRVADHRPESAFPLSPKVKERTALLKGIGNAINFEVGAEFIRSYIDTLTDKR